MTMSRRRKQQILRNNETSQCLTSQLLPLIPSSATQLQGYSEEFVAIGRRSFAEILIHDEL
jgi:hypothetical protein